MMLTRPTYLLVCIRYFIGLIILKATVLRSAEVVLMDTTVQQNFFGWATYTSPEEPVRGFSELIQNTGWNEATDGPNNPRKVYASCNVRVPNVNNWLRTPFIPRRDAIKINIEIQFTMRKCTRVADSASLQSCRETLQLFYYEANQDFANDRLPTWDSETYSLVGKIAALNLFEDTNEHAPVNVDMRSVTLRTPNIGGVYFAFQDEGACVVLLSVKVFYPACPQLVVNFAVFKETPAAQSAEEYNGVCVPNAVERRSPTHFCQSNGNWYREAKGECVCLPGYQGQLPDRSRCTACPSSQYKWSEGVGPCHVCPQFSHSTSVGSYQCMCDSGYYRGNSDPKSKPCTRPPSSPRNLRVTAVTSNSVTLTWNTPDDLGGRLDHEYRVVCAKCSNAVLSMPGWHGFNTTRAVLTNLRPNFTYHVTVYAENGVSDVSGALSSRSVIVKMGPSAKVTGLRHISSDSQLLSVMWQVPAGLSDSVLRYKVRYFVMGNEASAVVRYTSDRNITVYDFHLDMSYVFMVSAETLKGWGDYSDPLRVVTGDGDYNPVIEDEVDTPVGIVVGSIVAVLLCMLIATVMIVILLKRNRQNCNEKKDFHTPYSHVITYPQPVEHPAVGGLTVPLFPSSPGSVHSSVRTYVDPHTYEDPNQAVREFTREIDACHITIEAVIGGGEFGDVCKGKLRIPGRPEIIVALKTLKPGAADKNRLDFLTEASIMGQFDDPNVIFLEGVVTKSHPIMIATEYMSNGSLDAFLRSNDGKFTVMQLVGMIRGIASGMAYLADMGYVHRDLAARNILVNEILVCKVADFGLSREILSDTTDGAYTTKGGKIPVRWTSPEAIAFRRFTSASDVWSFGIVTWEVVSYGERPYWNWSNQDVIKAIDKGYRLPPPMHCPEALHQLMLDTWQKERAHRPKMDQVVRILDKLIRAPELLRKLAKRRSNLIHQSLLNLSRPLTTDDWLRSIKMERYAAAFLSAGIVSLEHVCCLTVRDLINVGVTLVGHQKKIMNSAQNLHAYLLNSRVSEGFLV